MVDHLQKVSAWLVSEQVGTNLVKNQQLQRHRSKSWHDQMENATDGIFSVNRIHKDNVREQSGCETGPWEQIWKSVAPSKVKCFSWLAARKACLTQEALKKKGFQIVSKCFLCNDAEDTSSHLFLHCKVTSQIWSLFMSLTGIRWTMRNILLIFWVVGLEYGKEKVRRSGGE